MQSNQEGTVAYMKLNRPEEDKRWDRYSLRRSGRSVTLLNQLNRCWYMDSKPLRTYRICRRPENIGTHPADTAGGIAGLMVTMCWTVRFGTLFRQAHVTTGHDLGDAAAGGTIVVHNTIAGLNPIPGSKHKN
ncbi:hypothetical protein [Desulfopila sp. IMCC35008]|uniref:hypothetical protein n=1 Tax=Desulfopila sp. IMCC35008 TaxID=2653858 RepID=UPI0013CF5023|nr:hypothetical protein [Desulfopila sp. IMCC35008]